MGSLTAKKQAVSSGRYLSLVEPQGIASWHYRGASVREMARRRNRHRRRRQGPAPNPQSDAAILTWDRGTEMATNDLLRQYFPKGTALSGYTPQEHRAVLNPERCNDLYKQQ